MRFEGKLEKWNDDRGFGFIAPTRGGEPVFVHVSAFPRDGRRPQVGEPLSFEVEPAGDGKKRAIKVERAGAAAPRRHRPVPAPVPERRPRPVEKRRSFMSAVIAIVVVTAAASFLSDWLGSKRSGAAALADPPNAQPTPQGASTTFRCDGRKYCSQMTSCEEAKFFLRNCPGTQMDGDGDGVPCEKQWCNGPFGR